MLAKEEVFRRFGKNVKDARADAGLTQSDLADKINIHKNYVGRIENGGSNPSLWMIYKIATALKKKTTDLLDLSSQ